MEFHFNPKAPDVYQVTKAPTNKYDAIANSIGIICSTVMMVGFFGLGAYAIYKTKKGE